MQRVNYRFESISMQIHFLHRRLKVSLQKVILHATNYDHNPPLSPFLVEILQYWKHWCPCIHWSVSQFVAIRRAPSPRQQLAYSKWQLLIWPIQSFLPLCTRTVALIYGHCPAYEKICLASSWIAYPLFLARQRCQRYYSIQSSFSFFAAFVFARLRMNSLDSNWQANASIRNLKCTPFYANETPSRDCILSVWQNWWHLPFYLLSNLPPFLMTESFFLFL